MLKKLWAGWQRLGHHIGDFQARWLLTIFYFCIAAPFALMAASGDPLQLKRRADSAWSKRPEPEESLERARQQF